MTRSIALLRVVKADGEGFDVSYYSSATDHTAIWLDARRQASREYPGAAYLVPVAILAAKGSVWERILGDVKGEG